MKYKTFITLVISAGVIVGGGLVYLIGSAVHDSNEAREQRARETYAAAQERRRNFMADPSGRTSLPLEQAMSDYLGKPATSEKVKDLNNGAGPKINLYAEGGVWVRAKVDLDRDDKWDQKWRWDQGTVYRKIAIADDEVYGVESAVGAGADPPSAPTPEPAVAEPSPAADPGDLRDVDELMLELLDRPVVAKIKDASKGRPFKINLYSDDGQRFNRAKVDLDRDDKWDEKWTFDADGAVSRKVSSADDDATYDQRFALEAGARWQAVSE